MKMLNISYSVADLSRRVGLKRWIRVRSIENDRVRETCESQR
jgi:hypothetical protein